MAKKKSISEENLVIVESPAKAKTIEKFLGSNFLVKSSYGHIRDLSKKDYGIDIENNYLPNYIVSEDKVGVVKELKSISKKVKTVWLASDEDREGEAIAWHLYDELGLKPENTKRIVFHEITKDAILNAIENPREININLVNAQQARRVLDRLVGFELSPVLWKKVKPSLSAGRVQSVTVRLIVEREREIFDFKPTSSYRVVAVFTVIDTKNNKSEFSAELNKRFNTLEETKAFLEKCNNSSFFVDDITKKPLKKSPAPPFTTSTLQQEASRKLGFSVSKTMSVAQKLYEAGKITYMRTDSVNLANTAVAAISDNIINTLGDNYLKVRKYKNKTKGAQEAHEAIRPSYPDKATVAGTQQEKKLYELIYKRTMASQMSDAKLEKTTIKIGGDNIEEYFVATGEVIKFDGFLKVYLGTSDDESEKEIKDSVLLPKMNKGQSLNMNLLEARERFSQRPPRYSEASLVKKLEDLGIGRPSTYAPTIYTVQNRGYVVKEEQEGVERNYNYLTLVDNKVVTEVKTEITGADRNKLSPTDIGMVVNDFLMKYFSNIVSYDFTAKVEAEFDEISLGKIVWNASIDDFYKKFHTKVEETLENSTRGTGERILGEDPKTGKVVSVKIGRYGPMAQIGESDREDKPKYAALQKGQHIETITLDEALKLFDLPRDLGLYEDKKVVVGIGRFGPYVRHDGKFVSLKKGVDDPLKIELDRAIELIEEKRKADREKFIKSFEEDAEVQILNGRWGPYIAYQKKNYKIPKDKDPLELTYQECKDLIEKGIDKKSTRKKVNKTKTKKTTKTSKK